MYGKVLKVVEYNLTFGESDRLVNVYGLFKYKKNNNLYIVYSDTDIKYNYISYGSSHIKNNSALSMSISNKNDEEIIKEYIFQVINKEELDNFEIISLNDIEGIEIISSNKLEVKPDVLYSLVDLTIPKKQVEEPKIEENVTKKKGSKKVLFLILILIILGGIGFYFLQNKPNKEERSVKSFTCSKTSSVSDIKASLEEENTYLFDTSDKLQSITEKKTYTFNSEEAYQEFINKGLIYKYIPEDEENSSFSQDDNKFTLKTEEKINIDISYNKPTDYEEALSSIKEDNYSCIESLVE